MATADHRDFHSEWVVQVLLGTCMYVTHTTVVVQVLVSSYSRVRCLVTASLKYSINRSLYTARIP